MARSVVLLKKGGFPHHNTNPWPSLASLTKHIAQAAALTKPCGLFQENCNRRPILGINICQNSQPRLLPVYKWRLQKHRTPEVSAVKKTELKSMTKALWHSSLP